MTVIAAASLFDGVMIMADCRVTIRQRFRRDLHCDIAQKLFPLSSSAAIGYAGDVRAAAMLLPTIGRHLRRRPRRDPVSIARWLPRILRTTYGRMQAQRSGAKYEAIHFIFAATVHSRPNVVSRARVGELVMSAVSEGSTLRTATMPDLPMRILMMPAEATGVVIRGTPSVMLGVLRSPRFEPEWSPSLSCIAIGSGGGARSDLERDAGWILTANNDLMAQMGLEGAIHDYAVQNEIETVGGMYPCLRLGRNGLSMLGAHRSFPPDHEVALTYDRSTGRWQQVNVKTGKRQRLLWPWEIVSSLPRASQRFDDYRSAIEAFNPLRAKRP